jgi:hypothetical protein
MEEGKNIAGVSENIAASIDKNILSKPPVSNEDELLKHLKVGISISDSPDLLKLGYSMMHLQDASVEFARYLFVHGATMIYGGDLRKDGFTYLFSELAKLYSTKARNAECRFINYFAWPVHLKLDKFAELDFKQMKVEIVKLPPPIDINVDANVYLTNDTIATKVVWAKSFTYLREQMNLLCNARIFLGGKVTDFSGKYPGIVEEALYALEQDKPVYLIGTYGGATKEIINLLLNTPSAILTEEYQTADKQYQEFYNYWNETETQKIDYQQLNDFFKQYGLKRIAKNNGLSEEENCRLFTTNNLAEMIFYILKGLATI